MLRELKKIQQMIIDENPQVRSDIRRLGGLKGTTCPIFVIPGKQSPKLAGDGFYFTTPSGKTIVHHPNAYGWRTQYHPSTRRVEVGSTWLKNMAKHRGLGQNK